MGWAYLSSPPRRRPSAHDAGMDCDGGLRPCDWNRFSKCIELDRELGLCNDQFQGGDASNHKSCFRHCEHYSRGEPEFHDNCDLRCRGTPTGDISLIAEPPGFAQVGVGNASLVGGTATITTDMLPGDNTAGAGTPYPIIAHYAGDGTFAPGDSAPINVTVNRENSTTTGTLFNEDISTGFLTATTTPQYGTNYIMIVNVLGQPQG